MATAQTRTAAPSAALEQVSYEDLYARWEAGNWKSAELDFSADREQWHGTFSELERRAALWNYALFFHGEDSVTDNLSPFIDAAPREEQKYFLATQQVDEARHAVFFGRFMREVVEAGEDISSSLEATRPELTWGFRKVFERLDRTADELRRDRSRPMLAGAITLYHLVVEATLAQPGQHFIDSYLHERDLLPGFRAGMENVARDEQRHIAFGVRLLADLVQEDPECADAVAQMLRDVTPEATAVFVPPNWDERYVTCFGSTLEEVSLQGVLSLESKLRAAGLPLESLPGGTVIPTDIPPEERVARSLVLSKGNYIGEGLEPPTRDPQAVEMFFDTVRRGIDPDRADGTRLTLQWEFSDFAPWHLRVDNGSTAVREGRADDPDITVRTSYDDFVDMVFNRAEPRELILGRRLRVRGRPWKLWQARHLFPR